MKHHRHLSSIFRLSAIAGALCLAGSAGFPTAALAARGEPSAATPIGHLVVIFQENVSFDHYFATYPIAMNPDGQPSFTAARGTPAVNGLGTLVGGAPSGVLLTDNPNAGNPANGSDAINPFRLDRSQASTCDQDHNYGHEQLAFDQGLMDFFPGSVGVGGNSYCAGTYAWGRDKGLVMGYYDGNTVTALWNYAQHFAMSDNSYGTTFGPSTPGVLNLVAGNTYPATLTGASPKVVTGSGPVAANGTGTLVGDLDPTGDLCSKGATVQLGGRNIGDLLSARGVTWGSFMGGFDLTSTNADSSSGCERQSPATAANGGPNRDYIPHHASFQYWASTLNAQHTRPASVAEIGHDGQANHEYDLHDFFDALAAGNMPAVSFLKAPAYADGHAGYSDPLLEQAFLVETINAIMKSPYWKSTAIVIAYDDSDGWYDHQMSPVVNASAVYNAADTRNSDQLNGAGRCGRGPLLADDGGNPIEGRCGYGPRLPLMVISPFAKANFVDGTLTDQSSILRFIEDNWNTGRIGGGSFDVDAGPLTNMFDFDRHGGDARKLLLDPRTGMPLQD
ncbi:MAG TPA: alkaline phosphatase family protein [Casimicrobiaceae bacterium]|nr:alkaline phosphatase family protein [Casimicrobiaceae bacterium]